MKARYQLQGPYSPEAQWRVWGADYERWHNPPVFWEQERVLIEALTPLPWRTVLDVGCGFGRLAPLLKAIRPVRYMGLDVSPDQIAAARRNVPDGKFKVASLLDVKGNPFPARPDLVVAAEVLMHQPPNVVEASFERLFEWSSRWVVTVDSWPDGAVSEWCFDHDYPALYGDRLVSRHQARLQTVFVGEVPGLEEAG